MGEWEKLCSLREHEDHNFVRRHRLGSDVGWNTEYRDWGYSSWFCSVAWGEFRDNIWIRSDLSFHILSNSSVSNRCYIVWILTTSWSNPKINKYIYGAERMRGRRSSPRNSNWDSSCFVAIMIKRWYCDGDGRMVYGSHGNEMHLH
jgi:hypothetical protein